MGLYPNNEFADYMVFVHPLFLYTSVWCLIGFLLLNLFQRFKAYDGQVFWLGVAWFCLGMIFISGLSTAAKCVNTRLLPAFALNSKTFTVHTLCGKGLFLNLFY